MAVMLGEYQEIFLEEAEEQIDALNNSLLALEKNYEDTSYINEIFRAAHSLKSSAAFVGLNQLSDMAHHMENLLQQVRDGQRVINDQIIEVLFHCFDVIRNVVDLVSRGDSPDVDMSQIMTELQSIIESNDTPVQTKPATEKIESKAEPVEDKTKKKGSSGKKGKSLLSEIDKKIISDGLKDGMRCFDLGIDFEEGTPALFVRIQLVFQQLSNLGKVVKSIPENDGLREGYSNRKVRIFILTDEDEQSIYNTADVDQVEKITVRSIRLKDSQQEKPKEKEETKVPLKESKTTSTIEEEEQVILEDEESLDKSVHPSFQSQNQDSSPINPEANNKTVVQAPAQQSAAAKVINQSMEELTKSISQTVKVSVKKLDDLLNNVAELVIANSGFVKIYDELRQSYGSATVTTDFKNRIEQMTRIAKDLQSGIMNTRMIPIGTVFKRFNRLIRDLTKEHRKEINLILRGEETELDKKVIDSIGEPLLHLIRNSVDHGIEPSEERKALGKDPAATIMLNSYQGGNRIIVEVLDDGRGLSKEKIRSRALERGLINSTQLETMTDDDLYQLIFLPGFSTAEKITDISGRGVGMNVVKEVVTELSGSVNVETEEGVGTKFTLTFPLTTAIIAAIMVRSSEELYAIPLSDVVETIKVSEEEISTIESHEVIYLREDVLSLVRLNRIIDSQRKEGNDPRKKLPVVVVGYGNRKVGLVVDKLEGKQEIVIKSLEQNFRSIEGLSGASILGDGSIALILDVQSMINLAISRRVKIEEERYRQKVLLDKEQQTDQSAEDYFRSTLAKRENEKKEEQKKSSVEPLPTASIDSRHEKEAAKDSVKSQEDQAGFKEKENVIPELEQEKMREEIASSSSKKVDFFSEETTSREALENGREEIDTQNDDIPDAILDEEKNTEAFDAETSEKIENIRMQANERIRSAAQDGKVDELLLDMSEIEKISERDKRRRIDNIQEALGFTQDDLDKILKVCNLGINKAAESLSMIVNQKVQMAIPELKIVPVEDIASNETHEDEPSVSIIMRMDGNVDGHIVLSLSEQDAQMLVGLLYNSDTEREMELDEDAKSGLKEITNIVGSGLLNEIGNQLEIDSMPSVPELIHDFFSSTTDSIIIEHAQDGDYALFMNTEFFISDTAVIGKLFMMPKHQSMLKILDKIQKL